MADLAMPHGALSAPPTRPGDSDPDPDEALRRVRAARTAVTR